MNVIQFHILDDGHEALNGLFSGLFSSTSSKEQEGKANNTIDSIKNSEGFNDLMYMKPEQAARTMNIMLEKLHYNQALSLKRVGDHKSSTSKAAYQKAAGIFSDAISEVTSQFRQYALGMDGEIKKLGVNKKKIDGFEFQVPFYKLVLPQKAAGTNPVDGVTKDELLTILQGQTNGSPNNSTPIEANNNTAIYIGAGIGALVITGGIIYAIKSKK